MGIFDFRKKKRANVGPSPKTEDASLPMSEHTAFLRSDLGAWYRPVLLGPSTLGLYALSPDCLRQAIQIIAKLEPDDYVSYLMAYYQSGLDRYGDLWRYADIVTGLLASARLVQPKRYLEIGVRRGRSMAMVAASCPKCEIVGFDLWTPEYAGISTPGPDFVRSEMEKVGYVGMLELIGGDSHRTLPLYFQAHPQYFFDLITVDGDHSEIGAELDLRSVLSRLSVGGVIVFDDICHPAHPSLADVWRRVVASDTRFASWKYDELGYGVALAVRMAR